MDDELLRSLWQPSEEDSFFDYWDPEKKKARKEVMKHLGEMVTSAPCPKEGENTSNLYRMLVKKLREQISNFDTNPEVVDLATKKLAKWVENLVKEAYYRKQGRITSPIRKPAVQEETVIEEVQEARIDKTKLQVINPEKDLPKSKHLKDLQENILKKALRDSGMLDDTHVTDVKIRKRPNVIYKQKDYMFPVTEEHSRNNDNTATSSSELESSPKSNLNKMPEDESNLTTQTKNLKVQDDHVVVMKPDKTHVYIVDQEVQVSKDFINNRGNKENRRHVSEDEPSVSTVSHNSSSTDDESKSSARLVKNWSSWMVNLTKKAKSLVQWDVDLVDQVENSEVSELNKSDIAMQEKWNKLLAVNEALKLKKALEKETAKARTSDQQTPTNSKRSTSKNRGNRPEKDNEKDTKHI